MSDIRKWMDLINEASDPKSKKQKLDERALGMSSINPTVNVDEEEVDERVKQVGSYSDSGMDVGEYEVDDIPDSDNSFDDDDFLQGMKEAEEEYWGDRLQKHFGDKFTSGTRDHLVQLLLQRIRQLGLNDEQSVANLVYQEMESAGYDPDTQREEDFIDDVRQAVLSSALGVSEDEAEEEFDDEDEAPMGRAGDAEEPIVVDVGDAEDDYDPEADVEVPAAKMRDVSDDEDVSQLIAAIDQLQQSGLSMSNRSFDISRLYDMPAKTVKKIYDKVVKGDEGSASI